MAGIVRGRMARCSQSGMMTLSLSPIRLFHRSGRIFQSSVGVHRLACLTIALLVTLAIANLAAAQESVNSDSQADSGAAPEDFDPQDPWAGVEAMLVIGSSASNLLTSSTESVTRFDADLLQALGAGDISDLAKATPNLEIRKADATSPTFFIRGVGLSDFNANAGGAVAVYQDGVAMNSPALQLGQLFDISGVEVLRGPQGAGAGRNASAGAIKVTSVKPANDGEARAFLSASYGNYNALDLEGALELPLFKETLAARFSFTLSERDGWGENGCANLPSLASREDNAAAFDRRVMDPFCGETQNLAVANPNRPPAFFQISPVPGGLAKNVNDVGKWAARSIFRLRPEINESNWLLIMRGGQIDQQSTLGQAIGTQPSYGVGRTGSGYRDPDIPPMLDELIQDCQNAGGTGCLRVATDALGASIARNLDRRPERGDYNRVGQTKHDTWGVSLEGEIPVDDLMITTISAYDGYDRSREQDDDFTPDVIFESITDDDAWQFSQEILLEGEFEEYLFSWETGGYYLMEELDSKSTFFQGSLESNQKYHQDTYSFGIHAGFSWELLENITLEAGARYNWEQKDFEFVFLGSAANTQGFTDSEVWHAPTGTVRLLYEPTEDVSFYWKYNRGWKGGQFNASATQLNVRPAEPESIDSLEVGLSGYVLESRLGLTASLFYYKYDDYQVFVVEDSPGAFPQQVIINANSVQNYGAELEARIQPLLALVPEEVENLLFTVRFGWLETEYLDFTQDVIRVVRGPVGQPARAFPVTADFSGNQLINAPEYKVSIGVAWDFDLGRLGDVTPRYDGSWSADVNFGPNDGRGSIDGTGQPRLPKDAIGQRAFWLHNMSFRYRPPIPNLEIMGWVRNMTNKTYKTFAFDGSFFANLTVNWVGEPRTYGGTVKFTF
jgi:iron complex outermembrane receptor protein